MDENLTSREIQLINRIDSYQKTQIGIWAIGLIITVLEGCSAVFIDSREFVIAGGIVGAVVVLKLISDHGKLQKEVEEYQSELDQLKKNMKPSMS